MASIFENISQGSNWISENIFNPIGSALGLNNIRQEFGYNPEDAEWDQNQYSGTSMANLGALGDAMQTQSRQQMGMGTDLYGQAQQMMSGKGEYYDNQRGIMEGQIGSGVAAQQQAGQRAFAQRGMGGGGMRDVINSTYQAGGQEQMRASQASLLNQGMGFGQNMMQSAQGFMGQSNQALGMASNAYGTQGQLAGQINALEAETAMFNADQANREREFAQTAEYNQAAGNRDNRAGFMNNLISTAGSAYGAYMGGKGSDISIKENLSWVGSSPSGTNIWEWEYNDKSYGEGTYRGVIAQEVPEATVRDEKHNLNVDYSKTDVKFERIK